MFMLFSTYDFCHQRHKTSVNQLSQEGESRLCQVSFVLPTEAVARYSWLMSPFRVVCGCLAGNGKRLKVSKNEKGGSDTNVANTYVPFFVYVKLKDMLSDRLKGVCPQTSTMIT